MYKIFITSLLLLSLLHSKEIRPIATLKVSGIVSDFVKDGNFIYVATDAGIVDIIDIFRRKIVSQIHLPPINTVMKSSVPSRIHSIDRQNSKTLLVTSASNAYRNIWIHDATKPHNKRLTKIIDEHKHLMTKRAFFTNDGKIVLGTFGSDISLYDTNEGYQLYQRHISESTMGGMVLSADKKKMVISDESGTVRLIDINSSTVKQTFSSEHVDNIYSVAYAQGVIITGGQDRRVGVYNSTGQSYHLKSDFLVYCVGLSPSGLIGAYSSGTENHLQLFNTKTKAKTDRLIGHYATPNKIQFITENLLISSGDESRLYFWKLD